MQCPACSHDNPDEARFCSNCGTALEQSCPVCSVKVSPGSRFCWNCGTPLTAEEKASPPEGDLHRYLPPELVSKMRAARAGQAMRGERRTVTMLFADIQGSTAAAQDLDPEDWAEIINGAFEHLIAPVYRYEGTLARLQGDAILAFFGAPIAHEDDAVRAVRAALEIVEGLEPYKTRVRERWKVAIDVRVGINTGLVVVGEVGSDLRMEYTALGDAINVAARMEQTAEPGTVRITQDTLRLVGDAFETEALGDIEVKGKTAKVAAFRVRGLRREEQTRQASPIVGRASELGQLESFVADVRQGSGGIASVIGEAGVGKSRLLEELRRRAAEGGEPATAAGEPGDLAWIAGSSRSYDASIPYSLLRDVLRRWWRSNGTLDFEEIGGFLSPLDLDPGRDTHIYLAHLVGVPLPPRPAALVDTLQPPVLQQRVAEALNRYMQAEAARRPVVLALEDLHWADPMSLTLVEQLLDLAERTRLSVLFAMRPYRDEPTWRIHQVAEHDHPHRYRPVWLDSLDGPSTRRLLEELLEGVAVPEATVVRILERSDGNPLFIEEMVRSLREPGSDADQQQVPASLGTLLTARLDRLDEESKLVAQMASVMGSEFDLESVRHLTSLPALEERMTDLLRRGILVELPGDGSRHFRFRHALMHDAAYSTILLRTRRELHARAAAFLLESDPEAVQEISRHLIEAGQPEAAFPHLVEAGRRASRSMALSDAIGFFTTALESLPADADPDLVVRAHDGLGAAHALVPDLSQSAAAYQRLLEYGRANARPSAQVTALNRLGFTSATLASDFVTARNYLEDARRLAEETGDELGLAEYHMNACFVETMSGDIERAVAHDEETVRLGSKKGVDQIRIAGLVRKALNLVTLANFDEAGPAVEDALRAAREAGAEEDQAILEAVGLSGLLLREGSPRQALDLVLPAQQVLLQFGSFYAGLASARAAVLLNLLGDLGGALENVRLARSIAEDAGQPFAGAAAAALAGTISASLFRPDLVPEARETALDLVGRPLGGYVASTVWADLGFANLRLGRTSDAKADFAHGLQTSSATRFWEHPRLLVGHARALIAEGATASAEPLLDEADAYALERDFRCYSPLLRSARGGLLLAQGREEEGRRLLEQALAAARMMGLRPMIADLELRMLQLAVAAGDDREVDARTGAARSEVEAMAATIGDEELQRGFRQGWEQRLEEARSPAGARVQP